MLKEPNKKKTPKLAIVCIKTVAYLYIKSKIPKFVVLLKADRKFDRNCSDTWILHATFF